MKHRCDDNRLVAYQEWNVHQYMLWYRRRRMRCVFTHYTTTLFKPPTEHTADMPFSIFQHLRAISTSVWYVPSYLLSVSQCSQSLSHWRCIQVHGLIAFLFFLVLNVGQSFDVKTRVREFCTGKMSHSISHRYVPLGPPTHSSGGSSGNGGGAAQKPKPGTGSGGQTNSSAGSTKNSK